jgi:hypothetical protein
LQADGHLVLDRELQEQVHAERLGGQRPEAADFLARWRVKLCLKDAEAAGIANGSNKFGAAEIRSHRRDDDRMFDPQHVAESGSHEGL